MVQGKASQRGGTPAQRSGAPQQTVRMRRVPEVVRSSSGSAQGASARTSRSSAHPHSRAASASQRSARPHSQTRTSSGYTTASRALREESMRAAKAPRRNRAGLIAAVVAVVVVAAVYVTGVWFFSGHFYPQSTIGDVDISLKSADEVASALDKRMANYALDVQGDGFSWTLTAADAGLSLDHAGVARAALSDNNAWTWPVQLLFSHNEDAGNEGEINEDALKQAVDAQVAAFNEGRTAPQDASIAYNEATGSFAVVPEVAGDQLDAEAVLTAVRTALLGLRPTLELGESEIAQPARLSTDPELASAVNEANALLGTDLTLTMGGTEVATVDAQTVASWITLDENYQATVSEDAVTAWVSQLADQLDTVGSSRTYTRADGKQVTVSGGTYGWTSNEAQLVQDLKSAVTEKRTGELAVPTKQTAAKYTAFGQPDWGAYVDVDITEQHARYYDASGNLVWESGIITGNPSEGNDTPEGIYFLNNKLRDQKLIGATNPATGEPEYESPVSYWMPFVDNLVGLHDASWQRTDNFSNPEAYYSVGSHGCVNLPPDKAAELFNVIQVGDCVIVHK